MSGSGSARVRRGGGPAGARVAYRGGDAPSFRNDNLGFRLVRIITPAERLGELSVEEKK